MAMDGLGAPGPRPVPALSLGSRQCWGRGPQGLKVPIYSHWGEPQCGRAVSQAQPRVPEGGLGLGVWSWGSWIGGEGSSTSLVF